MPIRKSRTTIGRNKILIAYWGCILREMHADRSEYYFENLADWGLDYKSVNDPLNRKIFCLVACFFDFFRKIKKIGDQHYFCLTAQFFLPGNLSHPRFDLPITHHLKTIR